MRMLTVLVVCVIGVLPPLRCFAQEGPWFGRIGIVGALYNSSARIATDVGPFADASATATNNLTVTFDVGYDVTDKFSLLVMGGLPPKPAIRGEGALASLGELGSVRYGPVFLTGVYRMAVSDSISAYAGMGTAYAIILNENDSAVRGLNVHNDWGFVLQTGLEIGLGGGHAVFFDYKRVWLSVGADGRLGGAVPFTSRVKLDPSLISAGVKFRF